MTLGEWERVIGLGLAVFGFLLIGIVLWEILRNHGDTDSMSDPIDFWEDQDRR